MTSITGSAAPLYAQVAQKLSEAISSGQYPTGSLLPPEMKLCEQYGVSRITLRAAIQELHVRGMISRKPGVGTRVEATAPQERYIHETSSIEGIIQFTQNLTFHLLEANEIEADQSQADWLCCPVGERLTVLRGLRVPVSGDPIGLSTHFVRLRHPNLGDVTHMATGSLAPIFERLSGRRIDTIRQSLEAMQLSDDEAEVLNTPKAEAALGSWRWYFTGSDNLLFASHTLFPRGRYIWSATVRRDNGDRR
jgi:GntR family transcriptional regulator